MNAKLKPIALMLGLMGMLVIPAGAQNNPYHSTDGDPLSQGPILLIAGGSSLVATDHQDPTAETNPQSPAPELIVAEPLFGFGRVLEGEEVVHDFLIENRGAGDLSIHQVRTG